MMSELAEKHTTTYSGTKGLARLVMLSGTEPWLTRTRARYELLLSAYRDPDLAATNQQFFVRLYSLARDVVAHWHLDGPPTDPALIDEQVMTMLTYINGVMMSFVQGYPVVADADHLDHRIQGILRSVTSADEPR
jgi:hypothetical protein